MFQETAENDEPDDEETDGGVENGGTEDGGAEDDGAEVLGLQHFILTIYSVLILATIEHWRKMMP